MTAYWTRKINEQAEAYADAQFADREPGTVTEAEWQAVRDEYVARALAVAADYAGEAAYMRTTA
jgi:hypothetical protein